MATESFYEDMAIDKLEVAVNPEAFFGSGVR